MGQRNSHARRILVVRTGSVFEEGVELLLTRDAKLEVRGVHYDDETNFLRRVSTIFPDVVVISETGPLDYTRVFDLLASIQNHTPITVVVVRPNSNTVDVYEKRRAVTERGEDLLALVRARDLND